MEGAMFKTERFANRMRMVIALLAAMGVIGIPGGLALALWGAMPVTGSVVIVAGCVVLFAAIVLSGRYPVTRGVSTDARQTQWALGMALMPVGLVAISPLTGDLLWQIANQQALEVRYPLLWFVVWSVGLVAQLTWGSPRGGLGDELMRACLASALSWGLVAALLGMVALGMLVLVGAQAVVTAVPVVFSLVLWVIGLRLWWQVRRADGV